MSRSSTLYPALELLPQLPTYRPRDITKSPKRVSNFEIVGGLMVAKDASSLPTLSSPGQGGEEVSVISHIGSQSRLSLSMSKSPKKMALSAPMITLTFDAYFEEDVAFGPEAGQHRVRQATLFYYVNDFKLKVVEKAVANSGMTQGTLVRKNYILKENGDPYTEEDLCIGSVVAIYGREYHIVGCDESTRIYMEERGLFPIDENVSVPKDLYATMYGSKAFDGETWGKYHSKRNANKSYMEAMCGNTVNNEGREGYMKYGNSTLNFTCVWDNTRTLYGDRLKFTLKYYLSDDTLEIFSIPSGEIKEQFSRLLKRGKLPRDGQGIIPLCSGTMSEFYSWRDLAIGEEISLYGRSLRIVDTDQATRQFYLRNGISFSSGEADPVPPVVFHEREVPPPTAFGSEEDSLRSCQGSLLPGPPRMKKQGEDKKLCFFAKLLSGGIDDEKRRFVLTYFVQDDTLKVLEPPIRNSGFVGGIFLSRRSVKTETGETVLPIHLYVGCKLQVLKHRFLLYDANDVTLRWMEDHQLKRASFYDVISKIRPALIDDAQNGTLARVFSFYSNEPAVTPVGGSVLPLFDTETARAALGTDSISLDGLRMVIKHYSLIGEDEEHHVCEHEMITILRANGNKQCKFNYIKLIEQIVNPTDEFK